VLRGRDDGRGRRLRRGFGRVSIGPARPSPANEPADCGPGKSCCLNRYLQAGALQNVQCQPSCVGPSVCQTDSDCAAPPARRFPINEELRDLRAAVAANDLSSTAVRARRRFSSRPRVQRYSSRFATDRWSYKPPRAACKNAYWSQVSDWLDSRLEETKPEGGTHGDQPCVPDDLEGA